MRAGELAPPSGTPYARMLSLPGNRTISIQHIHSADASAQFVPVVRTFCNWVDPGRQQSKRNVQPTAARTGGSFQHAEVAPASTSSAAAHTPTSTPSAATRTPSKSSTSGHLSKGHNSSQTPPQQQQPQQHKHLRSLYPGPSTAPLQSGFLVVDSLHSIYYEVHGNPRGFPALVVHGGPGAGCYTNHARFFDPAHYRIVLVDQRGCGASTPRGCLVNNTTQHLVSDFEALRQHLKIDQWLLLGGSWGTALAMAYAREHAVRVAGLILRGVCLMRPREIDWMFGGGAGMLHPLSWARFLSALEPELYPGEANDPLLAFYCRLMSDDLKIRDAAARAWSAWEMAVGFGGGYSGGAAHNTVWTGVAWHHDLQPVAAPVPDASSSSPSKATAAPASVTPSSLPLPVPRPLQHVGVATKTVHSDTKTSQNGSVGAAAGATATRTTSDASANGNATEIKAAAAPLSSYSPPRLRQVSRMLPDGVAETATHFVGDPVGRPVAKGVNPVPAQALLEAHYSIHNGFLLHDAILDPESIAKLRSVPCIAVQGGADGICPPGTAYELHRAWPEMQLRLVGGAGHSMYDPRITHELLEATDAFRQLCVVPESVSESDGGVIQPVAGGGLGAKSAAQQVKGTGDLCAGLPVVPHRMV